MRLPVLQLLLCHPRYHQTKGSQFQRLVNKSSAKSTIRMSSGGGSGSTTAQPSCLPCSGMNPSDVLLVDMVKRRVLESLPLWTVVGTSTNQTVVGGDDDDDDDVLYYHLHRKFSAKNFQAALDAINAMGAVAERQSHHPDFHLTNYREVSVDIWTHKLKGVTENDLILAKLLDDSVPIDYSPKWLKSHPEANHTAKPIQSDI